MRSAIRSERGVALLMALAILVLVSMLGTAYVRYAMVDLDATTLDANRDQARAVAERAIQKAILQAAASAGEQPLSKWYGYKNLPLYEVSNGAVVQAEGVRGEADVDVSDETAKLNINYAPVRLLESVLGVSADTARQIRAAVPRPGEAPGAERSWFVHPDELVVRGFLTPEAYAALPDDLLTTHTVPGQEEARGFINVNTAHPTLLGAIVGGDTTQGEAIAAQRPFASFEAFVQATGRQPSEFAIPPSANDPEGMPKELALQSRLYKFRCEASIIEDGEGEGHRLASASLEAVVYFAEDGTQHILSWRSLTARERAANPAA